MDIKRAVHISSILQFGQFCSVCSLLGGYDIDRAIKRFMRYGDVDGLEHITAQGLKDIIYDLEIRIHTSGQYNLLEELTALMSLLGTMESNNIDFIYL